MKTQRNELKKVVEKYRAKFPTLDRDLLRGLIRKEKKISDPSELKKLDRWLKKSYATN